MSFLKLWFRNVSPSLHQKHCINCISAALLSPQTVRFPLAVSVQCRHSMFGMQYSCSGPAAAQHKFSLHVAGYFHLPLQLALKVLKRRASQPCLLSSGKVSNSCVTWHQLEKIAISKITFHNKYNSKYYCQRECTKPSWCSLSLKV